MKAIPFQISCSLLSFVAAWISVAAANAGPYPGEVMADNPVAYWRFEELPGATVLEEQTGNFPGAYTFDLDEDGFPLWPQLGQPGIDTNAATFHYYENGTVPHPSYASVPNAAGFNPQGPFTVEFWARPTTDPTNYIVPVGNFAGWAAGAGGWHFYQSPAPNSRWVLFMRGGGIFIQSPPVTKFRWYHLALVFDGTNVTFYVNGSQVGSPQNAAGYQANSAAPLDIGAGRNTGYGYFDGSLDELAIYTNALSLARIEAHYQTGTNSFRAGANPPSISRQPASLTNYAGHVVRFTVAADGTAPLSYQWLRGEELIAGATSDALTFTCGVADDGASYSVVITNLYGTIQSGVATLTVLTDLSITGNPSSITRYVGSMAAFRVVATGALPITFQWYRGSGFDPIAGATNETLWLSNVQPSDDGSMYYATVTNPFASADSAAATLTVVARPAPMLITGHARAVMADGPVAYWRLNETAGASTAVDAAGSFDGIYSVGAGAFTFGEATGVPRETDPGVGIAGGARIEIPYALELNPWGPFSVEAWVKPASLAAHGNDYRTALSSMYNPGGVGPTGWNIYQQGNNTWAWVLWGGGWANAFIVVPEPIVANNWYHLAIVYDGSLFRMYINGVARASAPYPGFAPNHGGPANLGWRSDNDFGAFVGTIDEVAFYNKALGAQQILTHALSTARITADWPNNRLSWPFGTLQQANNLDGPYSDVDGATSPWPITRSGLQRFYRIHVE